MGGERAGGDRGRGRGQDGGRGGGGRRGGRGRSFELMNYEKYSCRKIFRRGGAPREPKQLPVLKNDRCVLCSSKVQLSFTKVACARLAHATWHVKMHLCVKPRLKGRLYYISILPIMISF